MYKDDSIMGGCSDSLLRMMIEGKGNCVDPQSNGYAHAKNGCTCEDKGDMGWGLVGYPVGSVYAPLQAFDELYDVPTALHQGTIFAQLDLPFMGDRRIKKGGNCRD